MFNVLENQLKISEEMTINCDDPNNPFKYKNAQGIYVTFPQMGSFEIIFMNKKIFSKLTLGVWPNSQKIVNKIQDILSGIETKDYSFITSEEKSRSSFYLSRSKSRSHSRPQNLNKSLEKSANKDKPQTAQKERRNFPLIHENIGKFPPYLADGFFIEKALQKKFINKNSQSFIKNDERKSSKIPLKINNYGLLEIKLEKNDKKLENEKKNSEFLSKKTENEKENADFSGRKREKTQSQKEEIAKTEKILSRTEENIEKVRRKSDKKSSKNEENNEKDYQNMMIEEQQNNAMKTPIEQKNEKKTEDGIYEKNVSEKIPSLNHIEKPESNASKSRSYNNISENTNDTINEKTRSFNNSNEKTCGNDEKIQKTPKNDNNATNQKIKNIEKIQEIEKNEEKIEKTEKPIEKVQTITETYVVNFFEEDYNNEEFDKDSEKHYKPSSTPKDVKDVKIDQNPVQQIVHEEIIENSKESSQKKQIKNEISKDNKKIDVITKNNSLNDFSDEGLKRDDSTSGDHQIREISREKPKNRKKKKENSSNISDISDISQKSPPLNEKEAFLVENDSFLQAKSPKKGHKNFISELSSPSVNNSNSPKKMAYEYNVDFDKSSSFSPAGTLNKSLNKSKELSQLSPIGDFSGTSLREPSLNNKNSSKLQPLKEIGKSGDSSQDIHKKLTKLVPIKQSPTLERPITQEGNQRKRPLLTEIPNKKSEHLKYENEKFCSLNIPIKKLVKKKITVNNEEESAVTVKVSSSEPERLEIVNPENVIDGMGSLKISLLFKEYPVLDHVLYRIFITKDGKAWQKIMLTANYIAD